MIPSNELELINSKIIESNKLKQITSTNTIHVSYNNTTNEYSFISIDDKTKSKINEKENITLNELLEFFNLNNTVHYYLGGW